MPFRAESAVAPVMPLPRISGGSRGFGIPGASPVGTGATFAKNAGFWWYEPFWVDETITVTDAAIGVNVAASAGGRARLAIYTATDEWQPDDLARDLGEVAIDALGDAVASTNLVLPRGRYLNAYNQDAAWTARVIQFAGPISTIGAAVAGNLASAWRTGAEAYGPAPTAPVPWSVVSAGSTAGMWFAMLLRWTL